MKTLFAFIIALVSLTTVSCQTAEEYLNRGVSKANLQNDKGAIADYTKSIELIPTNATTYCIRGVSKTNLQDYRGANADFTKAIELDPNYADAYYNRGAAKLNVGQKNSGCLDLSKAGELGHEQAYDTIRDYCN